MGKIFRTKLFRYGFLIMLYVAAFIIAASLFGRDFPQFFGWCFTLVAAGIIFFPVSFLAFRRFRDCGIILSVVTGVGLLSWLSWFLSSIGFIPFTDWGCMLIMIICAVGNIGFIIAVKKIKGSIIPKDCDFEKKAVPMLVSGLVFLVTFIIWTYIRGFKPEALGSTESIMDYAFMKSMDKSYYMPATDMWMSGMSINYYYVGQFIATFLSKVSGVGVGYGYNFMLMTEAAMAFTIPYSIVATVFADFIESKGIKRKVSSHAAGFVSGIAVCLCSNFHYLIFYYLVPILRDITGLTDLVKNNESLTVKLSNYFFPNSTRYIGYIPATNDKTIHEFPAYSFILGDLHAHVINIMFVLCVLAVLYAYILKNRDKMKMTASGLLGPADKASPKTLFGIECFFAKVFDPCIVITAFFIGLFHMTNYWDYPIYFVVAGAVILYVNFVSEGARYTGIVLTVFHAAVVIIISKFVCLPFTISFNQIASEIMPVDTRTPLYQFLVLWGFPFLLGIVFIVVVIKGFGKRRAVITEPIPDNDDKHSKAKAGKKIGNTSNAAFVRFLTQTDPCDIFIMILVLCAMGLCLIPEVIYVKDIYSGDFRRANTMFKITYQAFLIFGTSFGFILARFLIFGKKHTRVFGAIALCLLLLSAGYVKVASDSWYTTETRTYTGLSSDEFLETVDNDEYEAILFLDDYAKGRPIIIEANGDSYSDSCRFSAWTGLPTLLGWKTHEWLWRSSGDEGYPSILTERSEAINDFYTADSLEVMRDVTEKYDISFVIIGKIERTKFGEELNEQLLSELGKTVFSNETVSIIEVAR